MPAHAIDWKLRVAVGREGLAHAWESLWGQGVAAGRAEGVVGTLLAVLVIAVAVLVTSALIKGNR